MSHMLLACPCQIFLSCDDPSKSAKDAVEIASQRSGRRAKRRRRTVRSRPSENRARCKRGIPKQRASNWEAAANEAMEFGQGTAKKEKVEGAASGKKRGSAKIKKVGQDTAKEEKDEGAVRGKKKTSAKLRKEVGQDTAKERKDEGAGNHSAADEDEISATDLESPLPEDFPRVSPVLASASSR